MPKLTEEILRLRLISKDTALYMADLNRPISTDEMRLICAFLKKNP